MSASRSTAVFYQVRSEFVARDVEAMAGLGRVAEVASSDMGTISYAVACAKAVSDADCVVAWFAKLYCLWPLVLARLMRSHSVLVLGGDDVAMVTVEGAPPYGMRWYWWKRWVPELACALANDVTVVSEPLAQYARTLRALRRKRLNVIPLSIVSPGHVAKGCSRHGVVMNARLSSTLRRIKGVDRFVAIARALPNEDFTLISPTPRPDDLTLPSNVRILPFMNREDFAHLLSSTESYLQLSRWESFGSCAVEAWMYGARVLSTKVGILCSEVPDGVEVCPEGDESSLVDWFVSHLSIGTPQPAAVPTEPWPIAPEDRALVLLSGCARHHGNRA